MGRQTNRVMWKVTVALITTLFASVAYAQMIPLTEPYSVSGVSYTDSVPTPDEVLGHRIGSTHTRPHQIVDYFRAVAGASDRVTFKQYGVTHENRPLVYAIVSSPENQVRLEAIRAANRGLSDNPSDQTDEMLNEMPAIVNMHYTVHGNEASGSEAAMLLLYHLAAGNGVRVDAILDSLIVIIDPVINPDGHDRFVDWANGNRGATATSDPQDREHNEPWPGGRTNHYWFDLNRDWLPVQQPESKGRLDLFHQWRPQALVDIHEMDSENTYFFQPGIPGRDNPNTPQRTIALTDELTKYSGAALAEIGSLYYSRESFDDFYYGKGSTFPDINGAVGVLFEQGSSLALVRETTDGTLTFGFSVRNQLAASIGFLEGSAGNRLNLLMNQRAFYLEASDQARSAGFDAWIIGSEKDPTRARELVRVLQRHRIEVRPLSKATDVAGIRYVPGSSYVIPVRQQQFKLLKASMEVTTSFKDSTFYDVSSWTLPLAFGLDHAEFSGDLDAVSTAAGQIDLTSTGSVIGESSEYAYVMPWGRYFGPRALQKLLSNGIAVRVALEPFSIDVGEGRVTIDRGAIVVPMTPRSENVKLHPDTIAELVARIAEEDDVLFYAVGTSRTESGPDLGSPKMIPLHTQSVALVTGTGMSQYRVGEVWHLLSERMGIGLSMIDVKTLSDLDLSAYTSIILVDGSYEKVSVATGSALLQWTKNGGRLIAIQRGAEWVVEQDIVEAEFIKEEEEEVVPWVRFSDRETVKQARLISGAIFQIDLDTSHPIAFGYKKRIPVFKNRYSVLKPATKTGTTVAVYPVDPLVSGYAPADRVASLKETAAITSNEVEDGRVILIQDVPTFRAFWYGTDALLLNAIMFAEAY